MKYVKLTLVALFSTSAAVFAACASGSDTQFPAGGVGGHTSTSTGAGNGTASGGGNGNTSSGGGNTTTGMNSGCIPQCNIDADCQNTCTPPASGVFCCDTQTSMCFPNASSTCPGSMSTSSGTTGT